MLVVLSDGEDHEEPAMELAKEANDRGLTICTIGIGTSGGAAIPLPADVGTGYLKDRAGEVVNSRMNQQMLEDLAELAEEFIFP